MEYSAFVTFHAAARKCAEALVVHEGFDGTPFAASASLQRAFRENVRKMQGVKRITGEPYATHPTRMALTAMELLRRDETVDAERVARYCLFHDYLEEGDGATPEGLATFRRECPDWEDETYRAGVLLTEPEIQGEPALTQLEKVGRDLAYMAQIERIAPHSRHMVTAALLDKLDNVNDLAYITEARRGSVEARRSRLTRKLGYFAFVVARVGACGPPVVARLVTQSIAAAVVAHGIDPLAVARATDSLIGGLSLEREALDRAVAKQLSRFGWADSYQRATDAL